MLSKLEIVGIKMQESLSARIVRYKGLAEQNATENKKIPQLNLHLLQISKVL
jgi:hypothetical protein